MRRLLVLLFIYLVPFHSISQASLAAEDIIDDVKVKIGSTEETFTIIRDARERDQWYYIPDRPRLYEKTQAGSKEPEFSLIRFQATDPQDASKLIEGGILQFGATMQIPPEAIAQIKDYLKDKNLGNNSRLSALPLKTASVVAYTPGSGGNAPGNLIGQTVWGNGLAPTFASQKMGFELDLTNLGSNIMETIANSPTGIPVALTYTYNGLTPKAGFKVIVDYDQTYSHYSSSSEIRAQASYFGWAGASYSSSRQSIYNDLVNNKCIKIEVTTGENFTLADADKYLQPILARINTELVAAMTPPPTITPAQAQTPAASGRIFSAGYSVAMKSDQERKHGNETIDFSIQQIIERTSIASGFIGIGAYPEDVRKRLVLTVPQGPIRSAYLSLPTLYDPESAKDMGISRIDINTLLEKDGKQSGSQLFTWKPNNDNWVDIQNKSRTFAVIPLLNEWNSGFENLSFVNTISVSTDYGDFNFPQKVKAFDGQKSLGRISKANFDIVKVDPANLPFKKFNPTSNLIQVSVEVKCGDKILRKALSPFKINNDWKEPNAIQMLVEKNNEPVTVTIVADYLGGKKRQWIHNGENIRSLAPALSIMIDESELKEIP